MNGRSERWTIVIGVSSPDVTAAMIHDQLNLVGGVETLMISFDEDDATRALSFEAGALTVDVRGGRS